jgi:hypothetical protein
LVQHKVSAGQRIEQLIRGRPHFGEKSHRKMALSNFNNPDWAGFRQNLVADQI